MENSSTSMESEETLDSNSSSRSNASSSPSLTGIPNFNRGSSSIIPNPRSLANTHQVSGPTDNLVANPSGVDLINRNGTNRIRNNHATDNVIASDVNIPNRRTLVARSGPSRNTVLRSTIVYDRHTASDNSLNGYELTEHISCRNLLSRYGLTRNEFTGNELTGNELTETVSHRNLLIEYGLTGNVLTGNESIENVSTGNVSTGNVSTGNMSTGNVSTGNMSTGNMSTGNVSTGNMSTGNVSTGNVSTGNEGMGSTNRDMSSIRVPQDICVLSDITSSTAIGQRLPSVSGSHLGKVRVPFKVKPAENISMKVEQRRESQKTEFHSGHFRLTFSCIINNLHFNGYC